MKIDERHGAGIESRYRSHSCGSLRNNNAGERVQLAGWIQSKRDHGGVLFVDLRDSYGVTQVVIDGEELSWVQSLRVESVVTVSGVVRHRGAGRENSKVATGEIEVAVSSCELLSPAAVLPFQIAEDDNAPEATRLTYRFLELRRERLHRNILLRSTVIRTIRDIMHSLGFTEFQTPILTSSSPEGARDFLVPSRHHPGKFFALPQAPQQFKQLLMVAGFDRYFQIAPCFRDEDPRADRSPGEFYQCDLEMSFVEQEDVFRTCERLFFELFTRCGSFPVTPQPFPRIPYDTAIAKYGTDKPDLRISLVIEDLLPVFSKSEFGIFEVARIAKGVISGIVVPVNAAPSRKYFDDAVAYFQSLGEKGLLYLIDEGGGSDPRGTLAKFVSPEELSALRSGVLSPERRGSQPAVLFVAAGAHGTTLSALGKLRVKLGQELTPWNPDRFEFCWITDYPMFEMNYDTNSIDFSHNPFSMPAGGLDALNNADPLTIKALQYDVVCSGYELSSGAIRNHRPDIMYRAFEIAGYSREDVDTKFSGMIRAFSYGAPPHGGMAPGVDRIVMLLAGESAIRDVIAFPLAQSVEDLMMGAPSAVSEKQLRDAHIMVRPPPPPPPIDIGK